MSKLDELIQQYCPDGVEYKAIQEISKNISSGGTPKTTRKDFYDGDIPWLRTQEVNFCDITDTGVKITKDGLKNSSAKWIPENCVIVAMYGATVGKIGINKINFTLFQNKNSLCFIFKHHMALQASLVVALLLLNFYQT